MRNEKGIVLILSLMIMTVLLIMGLTFLMIALKESQIATNYKNHTAAFYIAEAGLETAISRLNVDPAGYQGELLTDFADGQFDAAVERFVSGGNTIYRVTGRGFQRMARSTVRVSLFESAPSFFRWAAFGESKLYVDNNAEIDSYDCATDATGSKAQVGSNGNIALDSNAVIGGDVEAGGFVSLIGNAVVEGNQVEGASSVNLPPVSAGSGTQDLVVVDQDVTLSAGTYHFKNLSVQGIGQLKISGKVTIYLTGTFSMDKGTVGNAGGDPRNLSIVSSYASVSEGDKGADFNNDALFVGTFYGPDASVYVDNSAAVYGSMAGRWITLDNNSQIHYPECLASLGSSNGKLQRMAGSWHEVR